MNEITKERRDAIRAAAAEALRLLQAEDERNDKLHDLLEQVRETIRLEIEPEWRPNGLMKNIQNAVYAMRGRMRLMNDAAIVGPLREPLALLDALDAAEAKLATGEPVAWQHHGPRGGWITTDERTKWSERPLYAAAPAAEPVKVKPLTWTQSNVFGRQKRRGSGIFGEFVAFEVDDLSPEEIARKEAEAQAGYNARIRSALVSEKEAE